MQDRIIAFIGIATVAVTADAQISGSLLSAARAGDARSQYALGVQYENNSQVTPDWNEAAWWYRHAAEQGDVDAQRRLAWCYENGRGVSLDFNKALNWYLKAAELGDSVAQFQVGRCYRDISQDYDKSISWFHQSALAGYPPALNAIGESYRDGFGVAQSHFSAVEWFRKAAELNDPDANYNLGRAYQFGFGVEENVGEARGYYQEALHLGHPAAATALDRMRFRIIGEIKGLSAGDTLFFDRIPLDGVVDTAPRYAFKVVVERPGGFEYCGIHNHAQYYRMTHAPVSGKYESFGPDGLRILVENGEYGIKGNAADIYLSRVNGGDYDHPLVSSALREISDMDGKEAAILKNISKARKKGDIRKVKVMESALADLRLDCASVRDSARRSIDKFKILNPSSSFTLVDYLENINDYPVEDLRSAYNSLDSAATEGYYGKLMADHIKRQERVGVGCRMPFFAMISSWHKPVSLNDLLGKYSLIYYWNTEAASRMVDPEVVRLAEQYSDILEVVGVTPSEEPLRQLRIEDKYSSLLRHKWKDCEFTGSNKASIDLMALGTAPFFILISPEGEILARGREPVLSALTSLLGK